MIRRLVFTSMVFFAIVTCLGQSPSDNATHETEIDELPIDDFDRDHWAFRPIVDHPVPQIRDVNWARTPIDHFIAKQLQDRDLSPSEHADRATLIRRLCFDLTGLPPTPEQASKFENDNRPDAYDRLVDSLLMSPEHGRRWAQYWLDLARFAETDGFEHDKIRPAAWKYRDWVIDAFNNDLPYDQFVREQIAGDVLSPARTTEKSSAAIATAFCLSGPDMPDINSQIERKHVLLNEITSTVGAVFFSLQIGCAQCHDHKYDAISQADFYRLRAFFDSAVSLEKNKSVTMLRADADPSATSRLMIRGDYRSEGPVVTPQFPRVVNSVEIQVDASDPGLRRAQLAEWLTSKDHPITARTIVNRVWQSHFGVGFSTTPSDFGVMGDEPSHPELLDYLAKRLMEGSWSLKRLHREILLSSVYRMQSLPPTNEASLVQWRRSLDLDPDNRWLSRFSRRRLDAESLRDAMIFVSESLNHQADGPGVRPPLPPEMLKTLLAGQWQESPDPADHYRRSIYIFARRNLRFPFFATFDRPSAQMSCSARVQSTTAVQSLLLLNSATTLIAAEKIAMKVEGKPESALPSKITRLYRRLFSRLPVAAEMEQCEEFLTSQTEQLAGEGNASPRHAAWVDLCRALLNSNQFLYVD